MKACVVNLNKKKTRRRKKNKRKNKENKNMNKKNKTKKPIHFCCKNFLPILYLHIVEHADSCRKIDNKMDHIFLLLFLPISGHKMLSWSIEYAVHADQGLYFFTPMSESSEDRICRAQAGGWKRLTKQCEACGNNNVHAGARLRLKVIETREASDEERDRQTDRDREIHRERHTDRGRERQRQT